MKRKENQWLRVTKASADSRLPPSKTISKYWAAASLDEGVRTACSPLGSLGSSFHVCGDDTEVLKSFWAVPSSWHGHATSHHLVCLFTLYPRLQIQLKTSGPESAVLFVLSSPKDMFSIDFREWEEGREKRGREREQDINWLPPADSRPGPWIEPATQVGSLDLELSPRPFSPWADILSTETHQPVWHELFFSLNGSKPVVRQTVKVYGRVVINIGGN